MDHFFSLPRTPQAQAPASGLNFRPDIFFQAVKTIEGRRKSVKTKEKTQASLDAGPSVKERPADAHR